jgi:hypothetical protein
LHGASIKLLEVLNNLIDVTKSAQVHPGLATHPFDMSVSISREADVKSEPVVKELVSEDLKRQFQLAEERTMSHLR